MYWGWSFFGMNFLWWIFWAILIVSFFTLVTPVPRKSERRPRSPLDILQRRYAAGELSTAEYEERRAVLLRDRDQARAATTAERTPPAAPSPERTTPPGPTVPQPQ